jgi:hypothetical protein
MKKLLFSLAVLALPASAFAAVGNGIDMQWQDCVGGPAAVSNRVFNCTGNSTHNLILNFKIGQNLDGFVAFTAHIDILNQTPGPVSPFWHYESGGCNRPASPAGALLSTGLPAACDVDVFTDIVNGDPGAATSGFAYGPDLPAPGRGKFIASVANPGFAPIGAGENKFAIQLQFNTRNRVGGPGGMNCAGCTDAVALVWNYMLLESANGDANYEVTSREGSDKGQLCATVNGASPSTCAATPVHNRTWGSLKALYR